MRVLRGDAAAAREFSKSVIAERGVKHGQVTFVPITVESSAHAHEGGAHGHRHAHSHSHPTD
jgi:CopG family nickel-responsive transcriptional regulator